MVYRMTTKECIDEIYEILKPLNYKMYVKGKNGITGIQLYSEDYLSESEPIKYKIGSSHLVFLDNNRNPFLFIEIRTNSAPKDIVGPIPLYPLTKILRINYLNDNSEQIDINEQFLLLVVTPEPSEGGQKSEQVSDLEYKLKEIIDFKNKYSNLKDFALCEIKDFKPALKKLLDNNGYEEYAKALK